MSNIKMADFIGQSTAHRQSPATTSYEKVLRVFADPKTFNRQILKESTFADWRQSVLQVRDSLRSNIGQGINPDLKLELQAAQRKEQEIVVKQSYLDIMSKMKDNFAKEGQSLLTDIKGKKFPMYSARQKTVDPLGITNTSKLPDMTARLVGAQELALAQNVPLKYIDGSMLKNFADTGRYDLVSGLIERAALNQKELQGKNYQEIYEFGLEYYDKLGIQEDRTLYRTVRSTEKNLIVPVSTTMDWDSMRIVMAEGTVMADIANDNLLEV